ncbi:hypothetical protein ACFL3Z_02360 [Gemmatimonadota bacterium]
MPEPSLLQRLKDRKIVQWTLAYLAGAWVIYEATGTALEAWQIPVILVRSVHILLLLGLFVTVILSWYHGEKGRQRVSGPELLMVASLLVLAGVAIALVGPGGESADPSSPARLSATGRGKPSIAVLPCDNIGPQPDSAFYAKGIHETVLLQLQRISSLTTISRTSVKQYEQNPPSVTQIGAELGVGYVGECSVQKEADRIRVTFKLIDAVTDEQVLAEDYDRDLTTQHLLEINSDIASRVAESLEAVILPTERTRIESLPTTSLSAHDSYFLARHYLEDVPTLWEAVRFFELAIEEDPTFALAHSGLALAYDALSATGGILPPEERLVDGGAGGQQSH